MTFGCNRNKIGSHKKFASCLQRQTAQQMHSNYANVIALLESKYLRRDSGPSQPKYY